MRTPLTSAFLAAALALPAASQILYVDSTNGSPTNNGTSWAQAFDDLHAAFAVATPGTTIRVAAGFYLGAPYAVPAGVTIKGRYLPGYTTDLERQVNNQTVLWGSGTARVLTLGAGSVVDGFTIQMGQAGAPGGGGALIDGVSCTIRNCFFTQNNDSAGAGAAILVRNGANPRIESCVLYLNGDAASGAAIEVDGSSGTYLNLTVDSNAHSGFRFKNGATPRIHNSIFSNAGLFSGFAARGIEQLDTGSDPAGMSHNLFHNNRTSLYLHGTSELTTLAQVNALSFTSSNIAGDPKFTVAAAVYTIPVTSPCVDAGSFVFPQTNQCLYDNGRVIDGNLDGTSRIDIGAHEFADVTVRIPVDTHFHVHMAASSASGKPIYMFASAAPSPIPGGLLVQPFGVIFIDLSTHVVFLLPPSQVINYPPGVVRGIYLYFQALTTNFVGFDFSNPAVHVTN